MPISLVIPNSDKKRKNLNSILKYDFCKDSLVDSSLLNYVKVAFILFSRKNKTIGIVGLYNKFGTYELFIAIDKKYRNKGFGKKLINKVIIWSKKNNKFFFIQTFNVKFHRPALQLYLSCGFDKIYYMGKRVILMKKEYPNFMTIYRILLFYLSSLKYIFKN
jgi:ribosomal protein S18 acetylase RimI-like enzyme